MATKIRKSDVLPGEGRTFPGAGPRSIAVYHKDDGTFVALSADCPHKHCDVVWNSNEKTWDCPCHASRFKPDGRLIQGPAVDPLRKLSSVDLGEELEVNE
ncbi:MAG TPA: Rieske 2Fe-2S domain-containing protein [Candidatus Methylomirabilis sp.]|nr:Rieske 2Fe-2S domain-containing protein [Candidatus Methylomirabilis sp.]